MCAWGRSGPGMQIEMTAKVDLSDGDGRRAERVRTLIGARAVFNNGRSTIDCQIRNLSAIGAKLTLSESVGLPEAFTLEIPSRDKIYRAELRWRTAEAAGVEFIDHGRTDDRSIPTPGSVEALRAENALLKRRVSELVARLADLGHSERPE